MVESPASPPSGLASALGWLAAHQSSTGSYGDYEEHWTASAAYALWLNDPTSATAAKSYSYLAAQINNSSTWFWGTYGEADVPGAVLYSIASSNNLDLIKDKTAVATELLQFQQSIGGFNGYYDSAQGRTVTSSVDTDLALLGLIGFNLISLQNRTLGAQYLLSLQNLDGSFNLTSSTSYDSLYSLGPDTVSITALTLLALKSDGYTITNSPIANGLKFLSRATQANLCENGHVYSAALSTLALRAFNQSYAAVTNMLYILSQQNSDGGFSDISRSSYPQSNALDTGWAAYALEPEFSIQGVNLHPTNCPPVASFTFSSKTPTTGQAIQFNASSSHDTDQDQLSYNWTFGDGSSAEGVSPTHTYTQAGSFTVILTVTDSGTDLGPLSNTMSRTIVVQQAAIQKSPSLPLNSRELLILASSLGIIVIVSLVGAAFYLGRRSARRTPTPTDQ